jgi:hypothetical protein
MMLMALAAVALSQWTGPRTVEYQGPGNFCGGGYLVRLERGDRALVLPQGHGGAQGARVVMAGREVNIWNGGPPQPGRVVAQFPGGAVTQQNEGARIAYIISDETDFALHVTSDAFHGFKSDAWFFRHADFRSDADQGAECLAARSY